MVIFKTLWITWSGIINFYFLCWLLISTIYIIYYVCRNYLLRIWSINLYFILLTENKVLIMIIKSNLGQVSHPLRFNPYPNSITIVISGVGNQGARGGRSGRLTFFYVNFFLCQFFPDVLFTGFWAGDKKCRNTPLKLHWSLLVNIHCARYLSHKLLVVKRSSPSACSCICKLRTEQKLQWLPLKRICWATVAHWKHLLHDSMFAVEPKFCWAASVGGNSCTTVV